MVKKLISGVLKKGEGDAKPAEAPKEEVPDELPPLAQDAPATETTEQPAPAAETAEQPADPAAADPAAAAAPADAAAVPGDATGGDELPPLDAPAETPVETPAEVPAEAPAETAGDALPDVDENAAAPAMPDPPDAQKSPPDHRGYFSSIADLVLHKGHVREKALNEDLFQRMKENYDMKKDEIENDSLGMKEAELESTVKEKLQHLSNLETKWMAQKKILEQDKIFLKEKEAEIKTTVDDLKVMLKELRFKQRVPDNDYMVLGNGAIIRSLVDLHETLKVIDSGTFRKHVTTTKNDFAVWVGKFDEGLARQLAKERSKSKMVDVMNNALKKP